MVERSGTRFIRINANCTFCKTTCEYVITIEHDQVDENCNAKSGREYVDCKVKRDTVHCHEQKSIRLTGWR